MCLSNNQAWLIIVSDKWRKYLMKVIIMWKKCGNMILLQWYWNDSIDIIQYSIWRSNSVYSIEKWYNEVLLFYCLFCVIWSIQEIFWWNILLKAMMKYHWLIYEGNRSDWLIQLSLFWWSIFYILWQWYYSVFRKYCILSCDYSQRTLLVLTKWEPWWKARLCVEERKWRPSILGDWQSDTCCGGWWWYWEKRLEADRVLYSCEIPFIDHSIVKWLTVE